MLTKTTLCLLVLALAAAVQASSIPPHETYGDEDHHEDDHHEDDHHEDDHHEGDHHEDDHKDDHHDSSSSSSSSSSEEEEEDDHHDEHSQDHEASHEDLHDRLHDLDHEMDRLTSRLQHLHDDFDHKVEERSEQTARAVNIKLRMAKKDHVCTEGYFRCTSTEDQCISDILVCDGVKDCHDGSDESEHVCTVPFLPGQVWVGKPRFDSCGAATYADYVILVIMGVAKDYSYYSADQVLMWRYDIHTGRNNSREAWLGRYSDAYIDFYMYNFAHSRLETFWESHEFGAWVTQCSLVPDTTYRMKCRTHKAGSGNVCSHYLFNLKGYIDLRKADDFDFSEFVFGDTINEM